MGQLVHGLRLHQSIVPVFSSSGPFRVESVGNSAFNPGLSLSTFLDDNFASFVDQTSFLMELDFRQKMFPPICMFLPWIPIKVDSAKMILCECYSLSRVITFVKHKSQEHPAVF